MFSMAVPIFYNPTNILRIPVSLHLCLHLLVSDFFFFFFLGAKPQHMKVPRLGVELELQEPAYVTATAMPDLSYICDLHHSSRQCWILNPLSEARDRSHILMDTTGTWGFFLESSHSFLFCFLFLLFRAALVAYVSSQARG